MEVQQASRGRWFAFVEIPGIGKTYKEGYNQISGFMVSQSQNNTYPLKSDAEFEFCEFGSKENLKNNCHFTIKT